MKVVIAIDSLKGSLSSMEAGMAIKDGILAAKPDAEVIVKPLADGGEGTTDALIEGMNGERIDLTVTGPMHTGRRLLRISERYQHCCYGDGICCRHYSGSRLRKEPASRNQLRCW